MNFSGWRANPEKKLFLLKLKFSKNKKDDGIQCTVILRISFFSFLVPLQLHDYSTLIHTIENHVLRKWLLSGYNVGTIIVM